MSGEEPIRVFLSYSSHDKELAGQVKKELESRGLEAFLAHEDIEPTQEWEGVILENLKACDVFIPLLSENFKESEWTDQETGVAVSEEKLIIPEEFRYIPFLIYDELEDGTHQDRCTSCGICAKVCPPQCIWIVRSDDPETGRPVPEPTDFFIDIDICMNCGLCAEFCPFEAIRMDHDYEISTYDRLSENIYNKEKLDKPASYYASIRPYNSAIDDATIAEKVAKKAAKEAARKQREAEKSQPSEE